MPASQQETRSRRGRGWGQGGELSGTPRHRCGCKTTHYAEPVRPPDTMDPLPSPQRKRRAQGWPGHLECSFEKGSSYSLHMLPISSKAFHVHASSSETAFLVNSATRCAAVLSHGGVLGWFSGT